MIDTVVLTIPKNKYIILDHDKFSPPTRGFFEKPYYRLGSRSNFKCVQNPTKKELSRGIYKPRLTITKRVRKGGYVYPLRIEFSIPKLIFSNNFDEVKENDFDLVIDTLKERLKQMDILIKRVDLENAKVSTIHYSKNIVLTDYTSCSMVLNELAKVNLTKRLDLDKTSFRNEGQVIHYHSNSFEIAIYDKIKDLEQAKVSEKRSIEKDNLTQLSLFDDFKVKRPFEVLRIEIRLNTKRKIQQVLNTLNINVDLVFNNLFKFNISREVISHFWEKIERDINLLPFNIKSPYKLLETILANNIGIKYSKALKLLSVIIIGKEVGFRTLRSLLILNGKKNHYWYNLIKELRELNFPKDQKHQFIIKVSESIRDFEPLSLKYYKLNTI